MRYLTMLILLPLLILPAALTAQDARPYIVVAASADLYERPNLDSKVVGLLEEGQRVMVYLDGAPSGWRRVMLPNDPDVYVLSPLVALDAEDAALAVTGVGVTITESYTLDPGFYRVDVRAVGREYRLNATSSTGTCDNLSNILGVFYIGPETIAVSALMPVRARCTYAFNVGDATGPWEMTLTAYDEDDAQRVDEHITVEGTRRTALQPLVFDGGTWEIGAQVEGPAFILNATSITPGCRERLFVFNEYIIDDDVTSLNLKATEELVGGCTMVWEVNNARGDWALTFARVNERE